MVGKNILGIDLGTTNSVVAAASSGGPEVVPNSEGDRKTPSVVGYSDGEYIVGRSAVNQAAMNPEDTVFDIKRDMCDPDYEVLVGGEYFSPSEVSALILKKLKRDAESYLGGEVRDVVITVPAYFGGKARDATIRAGEIAGFNVERIVNEPTAACLKHGLGEGEAKTVAVYDLGGGTFDISVLDVSDNVFDVVATAGDQELGGADWDSRLLDRFVGLVESETGCGVDPGGEAETRLLEKAREAKHQLSSAERASVAVPYLFPEEGYNFKTEVSRREFEELSSDLVDRTVDVCRELFGDVGVCRGDVDEVILVGGSTRMPMVRDAVEEFFGMEPLKTVNPDEVVAEGAAIQASVLNSNDLPVVRGDDGGDGGFEAALQETTLIDVVSKSMGVELSGGRFSPIIEKNCNIPAVEFDTYNTTEDGQTEARIAVFEGEGEFVRDNELLDEFTISGLTPRPAGEVEVEVEFEIDVDGVLYVYAEEVGGCSSDSIEIETRYRLSGEEVDRMERSLPEVK